MMIANENAMLTLGEKLSKITSTQALIFLQGELGAGKTTLVRGFLRGLGYEGRVKSPTYTLVETYHFPHCSVNHFDFYRLKEARELEYLGIRTYFGSHQINLIEWPMIARSHLPTPDVICSIELKEEARIIHFVPETALGRRIIAQVTTDE